VAAGAPTPDEAVAEGASTPDEAVAKAEAVAEGACTADKEVAEGASADRRWRRQMFTTLSSFTPEIPHASRFNCCIHRCIVSAG